VNKCTTQLADRTEIVMVGTLWLGSFKSPKEFHVWDLPNDSTVHHPCSGAKGICLCIYKDLVSRQFFFHGAKYLGYHQGCKRELRHTQMV
jgi:hypothetical protein